MANHTFALTDFTDSKVGSFTFKSENLPQARDQPNKYDETLVNCLVTPGALYVIVV